MSKSKDNNVGISLRQVSEGQLLKYTNMVKGWQNRWFVLDPHTGMLEYFMTESEKKQKPRASLHLAGAIVVPSEEDSYTFSVNGANENSFKLRAIDARERQYWINKLRVVAQAHTQVLAESNPPLFRDHSQLSSSNISTTSAVSASPYNPGPSQKMLSCNLTILDAFSSVRDYLRRVECEHQRLVHDIESLPSSGPTTTCTDTEMLILKATSQATLLCLEQCLAILHYQQQQPNKAKVNSANSSPLIGYANPKKPSEPKRVAEISRVRSESAVSVLSDKTLSTIIGTNTLPAEKNEQAIATPQLDDESEYISFAEENRTMSLPETGSEEYKGRMNLLSQLKLGMELTRVNLPAFCCESRSLLQVIADAFRQPHLLLKLLRESNLEQRMAIVVQWYLGCIRACQLEMTVARKPFNPVLGENFKCIWNMHDEVSGENVVFRFFAEQVSHEPPVSAFHFECPQQRLFCRGNLSVKAKYMGMYVGVALGGDLVLELPSQHEQEIEKYEMSFPMLYLRSFLSEPWLEFGGKININCNSKISAGVMFQTKPFYGGKPHQVTVEIKNSSGNTSARMTGEWMSGILELCWVNGQAESVDLQKEGDWLETRIKPIARQAENESYRLWHPVRQCLMSGDFQNAGEQKKMIEERYRGRKGMSQNIGLYFELSNDVWIRRK